MARVLKKIVRAVQNRSRARATRNMVRHASPVLKEAGMSPGVARFALKRARRFKEFGKVEKKPWYVSRKKK